MIRMTIEETTNYKQFKQIPGNRTVDKTHVKELVRHMADKGNLTQNFPVIVNENFEVIDGQHRLEALKTLKWPVFYTVQPHLTISVVRSINQAQRNWNWKDYATSYAELGNKQYQLFLDLSEEYNEQFNIMKMVCGAPTGGHSPFVRNFKAGDLRIENLAQVKDRLNKLADIRSMIPDLQRPAAYALLTFMRHPDYNHERMIDKLEKFGERLQQFATVRDSLRAFEDIYNFKSKDIVRLF